MKHLIEEIRKALECGLYHCAFALTLTLPDICAQIAYPDLKGNENARKRYEKWVDEYVDPIFYLPKEIELPAQNFNGYACYLLRCAFLHHGDTNLKRHNDNIKIHEFRLHFDNFDLHGGFSRIQSEPYFCIDLDVSQLCYHICQAVFSFYCNHEKQFQNFKPAICDVSWPAEAYEQLFIMQE